MGRHLSHRIHSRTLLPELLGQPDENALGATDVAEPIHVFVLDYFVDELRAVSAEPGERIVEVVHGEHDTQVAQSVHRGVPVIGDHRRREKSREFDPAVAVRRTHHGDLDALVAQSSDAPWRQAVIVADRRAPTNFWSATGSTAYGWACQVLEVGSRDAKRSGLRD